MDKVLSVKEALEAVRRIRSEYESVDRRCSDAERVIAELKTQRNKLGAALIDAQNEAYEAFARAYDAFAKENAEIQRAR